MRQATERKLIVLSYLAPWRQVHCENQSHFRDLGSFRWSGNYSTPEEEEYQIHGLGLIDNTGLFASLAEILLQCNIICFPRWFIYCMYQTPRIGQVWSKVNPESTKSQLRHLNSGVEKQRNKVEDKIEKRRQNFDEPCPWEPYFIEFCINECRPNIRGVPEYSPFFIVLEPPLTWK